MARMKDYLMDVAEDLTRQTGASFDDVARLLTDGRIDLEAIEAAAQLPARQKGRRLRGLVAAALLFDDLARNGRNLYSA